MHDRSEWRGFERENTTVVSCHDDMKPLNGGSRTWSSLHLKGIKGKNFFVLLYLLLSVFSWHDACRPHCGGKR